MIVALASSDPTGDFRSLLCRATSAVSDDQRSNLKSCLAYCTTFSIAKVGARKCADSHVLHAANRQVCVLAHFDKKEALMRSVHASVEKVHLDVHVTWRYVFHRYCPAIVAAERHPCWLRIVFLKETNE